MNEKILKDYGWCQIIQRETEYIIRYDGGGIAIHMMNEKISKSQADKALINQYEAEQIVKEILRNKNQS
jgi:hypothetical protein